MISPVICANCTDCRAFNKETMSKNQERRNFCRNTAHEVATRAIAKPAKKSKKADAEKAVRLAFARLMDGCDIKRK